MLVYRVSEADKGYMELRLVWLNKSVINISFTIEPKLNRLIFIKT